MTHHPELQTVINPIAKNLDVKTIAELTGLSQIENLR